MHYRMGLGFAFVFMSLTDTFFGPFRKIFVREFSDRVVAATYLDLITVRSLSLSNYSLLSHA